jgi:pimeloyl-ACP methyl ester carboxylesterase
MKRVTLASGIELDVIDEGPADAPALIFLHGFPESHRTWRHQIAHLSGRFRCVAPDQRGYRGSSKPPEISDYTPDKLIGDIFQLADALGIERFTILGHDWGGAIAWGTAIAGQMNGRVTRAVVANAPHPAIFQKLLYTNHHQRESSQYMRGFRDAGNDAVVQEHGLIGILLQEIRWDSGDKMEPEERAQLLEDWQDRDAAFAMLNWYRASPIDIPPLDAPYQLPDGWTPPALPRLTIPTLVIWGMDDLALPPENLDGLGTVVEDLTLVEVPDSGHFVTWEAPQAVNAALDQFLQRTADGG